MIRNKTKVRLQANRALQASRLLPKKSRRKLVLLMFVQILLGVLDLVSVGLVGLLGTLAVAGVKSTRIGPSGTIGHVLALLGLADSSTQQQVAILAVVTCALFLARTAASIYLTRRALHFLSVRSAEASASLIDRLLEQPLTYLQTRTMQDFIFGVTQSVGALVLGVLGTIVIIVADAAMLIAMTVVLVYASPVVALSAGALLLALVAALHRLTTGRAHTLGTRAAELDISGRNLLVEAMATYRDMQVRGSRPFYSAAIRAVRMDASYVSAELTFMPNVSKYVLESAVILGALLVGALEFYLENAERAVGVLALFLAAGTRLAPAIIRLQQGVISLRGNLGQGAYALQLMEELPPQVSEARGESVFTTDHPGFEPHVSLQGVTYTYPSGSRPALADFHLQVVPGSMVALVGPSGAGKSTAADLILGILEPDQGELLISGLTPLEAELRWPGAIGYVPQDVWIAEGSVRKNVALGFAVGQVSDDLIWSALEGAELADVIRALPEGLDANVGERGAKLSGGQRQRLGIARALLTKPRLLVLDEATSALDAETEHAISATMHALRGEVTLIVIAHRLASVRDADEVIYFDAGVVAGRGRFDQVRKQVPNFDRQAALLGL